MDGHCGRKVRRHRASAAVVALAVAAGAVAAACAEAAEPKPADDVRAARGWTFNIDNDLFAFGANDRDYTAGLSVAFPGKAKGLARALDWIDARTGRRNDDRPIRSDSFAAGLLLFTPNELEAAEPLPDDRPFATLTYLASSKLVRESPRTAYQSSLTVGFLGLPLVEQLHRGTHDLLGLREPRGYPHQISDGGEPTFRYSRSRLRLLSDGLFEGRPYDLRLRTTASFGYLTEANAEVALRWGDLAIPWWSSEPPAAEYAGHPFAVAAAAAPAERVRFEVSAGLTLRARLYNGFLQGQVRASDVTYSSSELNHLLLEAWLGLTTVLKSGLSVSYTVRHQTEEIRVGRGERELTWASIGVAQRF